jgi:hypothetical protein
MKNPGFTLKLVRILLASSAAVALRAMAESPDSGPAKNTARSKPQVIYHLPPASRYGPTLHSQAKGQNNDLPIDSSMPTSLQISRANANAAAAQQQQTPAPSFQQRSVTPKLKSNRSQPRPRSFARPRGSGNPHANKHHKK